MKLIMCAVKAHTGNKGFYRLGAKLGAGAVVKLFNRFLNGHGAAIRCINSHRIKSFGNGNYTGSYGNILAS
jgi:hypothetical protein